MTIGFWPEGKENGHREDKMGKEGGLEGLVFLIRKTNKCSSGTNWTLSGPNT